MVKWLDNCCFYEIYPQSFQDSNSDGIGDFRGIIKRLDYIKELGCDAIWMNPCFESPFHDAGYDVSNFYKTAPRYGTNDDLKELFDEVHKRGMHILLDLVPGHTSVEHPWFKESMKVEENEYTHRYIWTDQVWKDCGNIKNVSGWLRGISDRDGSCAVNFFSLQPALNYGFANVTETWQQGADSKEATSNRHAMEDIMSFWLDMGCDGFRVDMAGAMVKQDEDGSHTIEFWKKVRKFLDNKYPDAVLVSEWGEPDKSLAGGFHMDFLLHFGESHYLELFRENPYFSRKGTGDISGFAEKYIEYVESTNGKGLICIPSGNHDMIRMRKYLDEEEMKIAFAFLLSMPGAPFIYYGDEIGMQYVDNLNSVEGGFERTGSRSPMQWDNGVNAGFSNGKKENLYIRQDESPQRPTVQNQMEDENSLYYMVKALLALRKEHPALQNEGKIHFHFAEKNAYPFIYERRNESEKVLVILNPSDKEVSCEIGIKKIENIIFSYHGNASMIEEKLVVPPCSMTFAVL